MAWGAYKNGNSFTRINLNDGTKIRETKDDYFDLEFPESLDISCTSKCNGGCKYCYANFNPSMVTAAVEAHDDNSPLLTGTVSDNCKITNYGKAKSLKIDIPTKQDEKQIVLFSDLD